MKTFKRMERGYILFPLEYNKSIDMYTIVDKEDGWSENCYRTIKKYPGAFYEVFDYHDVGTGIFILGRDKLPKRFEDIRNKIEGNPVEVILSVQRLGQKDVSFGYYGIYEVLEQTITTV